MHSDLFQPIRHAKAIKRAVQAMWEVRSAQLWRLQHVTRHPMAQETRPAGAAAGSSPGTAGTAGTAGEEYTEGTGMSHSALHASCERLIPAAWDIAIRSVLHSTGHNSSWPVAEHEGMTGPTGRDFDRCATYGWLPLSVVL